MTEFNKRFKKKGCTSGGSTIEKRLQKQKEEALKLQQAEAERKQKEEAKKKQA